MKRLLEKLVMDDNHLISVMTAIHLASSTAESSSQASQSQSTSKKITKQRAEDLLEEWSTVGYFINFNGNIVLGPRAIGEYRETFQTKFNDYIHSCKLCNEIALQVTILLIFL